MASNGIVETMRIFKEVNSPEHTRVSALTSLRRSHQKNIMSLKDSEFCELCNTVIQESLTDNEKLHIEACRTLDIVLPGARNRSFDFFREILQINRKKRLKILVSLSILKDETVAVVGDKPSVHTFLADCLSSAQSKTMDWLQYENADNVALLKKLDNRTTPPSGDEELEEKLVDQALKFLGRLCGLTSLGLNVRKFDTFVMEKVVPLAYMGHRKQRAEALNVLQIAIKNDIGTRIRSLHREMWEKYKITLQNIYCKRMLLLVNGAEADWAPLWESSITLIGTDLHRGSGLVNSLLKVEEVAFKSADPNRKQAFMSWKFLIDNFALDQRELATTRRIKLLCTPLNAKNSKTELMVLTKMEVWWHLICKVYPSISECVDSVLIPFLNMCFGPFGEKPLFTQKSDSNVSLGKKFPKTQLFAVDALVQLIVDRENEPKASLSMIKEKLPTPVSSVVFESKHRIFIHSFGEVLLTLSLLPEKEIQNMSVIPKVIWDSLIRRIEEYDKMKVPMYKEIANVVMELTKKNYHQMALIKNFLLEMVLKNFGSISNYMQFTEQTLLELIYLCLQVDNFSGFSHEHFLSIESLLKHLIKPKNADIYYPKTLEIMRKILGILEETRTNDSHMYATCEIWCIIARIAKQYVEDRQQINEGTLIAHKFDTIENIIKFPFARLHTDNRLQLKSMADTWIELYKQFDMQAELIVTVKPNEILNHTSNMIISNMKWDKKCHEFAAVCIDGLLTVVNYDELPNATEIPPFVTLLKILTMQCLNTRCFATDKVLKTFSSFLLNVFNKSVEKVAAYLNIIEPVVKSMLEMQTEDVNLELDISKTWSTIVNLFKQLQQHLNYELLNCYKPTIVTAMLHLNSDISSTAFSMVDLKDNADDKMKQVIEEIMSELQHSSVESNQQVDEKKVKKGKSPSVKTVGSFLNRRTMSPSGLKKEMNGKESAMKSKVVNIEPESQDFIVIKSDVKLDVNRLTDHQKDMLKKRRDDIPAMYNELTVSNSQDSQQLQQWFDAKSSLVNNNEVVPKSISADTLHFKNIKEAFPDTQPKKTNASPASSPRANTRRQSAAAAAAAATESSPNQQNKKSVEPPTIVKKLDFDSREEFPIGSAANDSNNTTAEQVSPSMIDQTNKMRRRSTAEENNSADSKSNQSRLTRRSLQQPLERTGTLRKFNSNEQLMGSKRGRKRRNSETNSEGTLDIEREKRARKDDAAEALNSSSEESSKSNESTQEIDGKKISKRTLNEMSRLKIDMAFTPLPSRRSVGKAGEVDNKHPTKEDKQKDESQNSQPLIKRRSMKGYEKETVVSKKDAENKKPEIAQNKVPTRRSLVGKMDAAVVKKKAEVVPDSQEEMTIEDVSTQDETVERIENTSVMSTIPESEETQETDKSSSQDSDKSSQDSDIVESSQEPTISKMDKVECFIKIAKVDLTQTATVTKDEETEKEKELVIPATQTQCDLDDSSISIIPPTAEIEKQAPAQIDVKKTENGKPTAPPTNLISSPKSTPSRVIRAKAFSLQGRAAQMLGLVTKQSIAEKMATDGLKESALTDEVTIVPLPKKDKPIVKEHDRVSSPGGSRQVKMFNNMNNNSMPQRCSSPSMSKFNHLNNDGEKVSPKLDKNSENSEKESSQSSGEDSPKARRELPLLEWSNANPPSLSASPSVSILKSRPEIMEVETPNRKKRVSFADPPVSREMGYEIMSDTSSPPRLEKLPSLRSPSVRKEFKRQTKLRLVQIDMETKDTEVMAQPLPDDELPSAKLKLTTVLTEISIEEVKISDSNDNVKTSTQEDKSTVDTSIKLDSLNLSNIGNKSSDNRQTSLDDTVDVENISSSLEITQEKPVSIPASQGSDDRTLPVTDSIFSNLPLSQETQNSVAHLNEPENLDSTLPVYPSLISCVDAVDSLSADLVDPLFTTELASHLSTRSIRSIGDLAQLTERDVNRLPIKSPKVECVRKALSRYEERINRTPEKRPSIGVPSSTPLGPRRATRARPDNDSFEELMKSSDLMSTNVSALRKPAKRPSSDTYVQTSPAKRTRKGDEKQCLELMEQCDDDVLFEAFVKRFGADRILKGYKDKMSDKTESELKRETLDILGLSMQDDSDESFKASTKTAGLQKVLRELPNIFEADDKFIDAVLKTYKKKFKASQVLKSLKPSELKEAITDEFSASELLDMLASRLSKDDKPLSDTSDLQTVCSRVPTSSMLNQVGSRNDVSVESLLNLFYKKCPENPSDDVRKVLLRIITEKYEYGNLLNLTHEAQRLGWQKSSGK